MADFVAVIRRTVDGLSDNVPEMRSKVYEKARGAVRRQLENMKPRPSDDMIERQMVKLEAAISEVESDYAEALPALDDADLAPEAAIYEEPVAEAPEEVPAETAPVHAEPEPAVSEPVAETEETVVAEEAEVEQQPEPVEDAAVVADEPTEAEIVENVPVSPEPEAAWPEAADLPEPAAASDAIADDRNDAPIEEPETVSVDPQPEVVSEGVVHEEVGERLEADDVPVVLPQEPWHEPATTEAVEAPSEEDARDAAPAAGSEWELPEWEKPAAATAAAEPVWTESADEGDGKVLDLADYMPPEPVSADHASHDTPAEPSHSWEWDDSDPFQQPTKPAAVEGSEPAISDWSWPVDKTAAEPAVSLPTAHWDDIDRLLDKGEQPAATEAEGTPAVPGPETMPPRPVSYGVEPRRSGSGLKIAGIAAAVLLVLGGSGYAYWLNRDAVNNWISATVASVTTSAPVQPAAETTEPAATTPEASNTDAAQPQTTDVAALDSGATKFTQRLQTDGTEVDNGPAAATSEAGNQAEGKSVAPQTEAGTPVAQADAATTPATGDATTPATTAGQPPATATVQVPEGAQKMFLYEERLGQSSPTAIEGTVAWSLKEESPGNDAPPEPTVQAQISVPERGLTALMTLKRNTDPSLPASHVIEFVFSLPENFEGGAIDSVQRVSMKQNEQARGDALIAVPAKITDDFHMIALNDYPEAVATNTELLRTRSWIDVPLTYRNGRRALLTLEKGPAGTEAFTKALQAWSRAPAASGQ